MNPDDLYGYLETKMDLGPLVFERGFATYWTEHVYCHFDGDDIDFSHRFRVDIEHHFQGGSVEASISDIPFDIDKGLLSKGTKLWGGNDRIFAICQTKGRDEKAMKPVVRLIDDLILDIEKVMAAHFDS
jgi:hypothetical protein